MATRNSLCRAFCFPAILFFLLTITALPPAPAHAYELLIGTGKADSFSHFAGKAVCRALHKAARELTCRTVPTENYTDSLTNVLSGSLDMALVNSKIIHDAFQQSGPFQYISLDYDQLRLMMPLYRLPITLLVRQDAQITELDELAGKKVNGGAPSSLEDLVFREIMAAEGWQEESFSLLQGLSEAGSQDYLALSGGTVQAMLHIGMHPDKKIRRALENGKLELVAVSGQAVATLVDNNRGFYLQSIPGGTYFGQFDQLETLSLETLLVTSADTDEETVRIVLTAIYHAKKQLQRTHRAFLQYQTDVETLNASYLHPHPTAILFFQTNQSRLQ